MTRNLAPLSALLAILPSAAGQTVSILARSDTAYPSLPAGATLDNFMRDQFVGPDGTVIFTAYANTSNGDTKAVLTMTPNGPQILAKEGTAAGSTGFTYAFLNPPVALSQGRALVSADLHGGSIGSTTNTFPFIVGPGSQVPLAIWQQPAPGGPPGSTFGTAWPLVGTDTSAAFLSSLYFTPPTSAGQGIWVWTPTGLAAAAVQGQQAIGFPAGVNYFQFLDPVRVNRSGQVVFNGTVSNNLQGLWTGSPGNLSLVLAQGSQAPGLDPLMRFSYTLLPTINTNGDVLFTGGGIDISQDPSPRHFTGLWRYAGGTLSRTAIDGDAAPGTQARFVAPATGTLPLFMNADNGFLAFRAGLAGVGVTGTNNSGIWAGTQGHLRLVARTGSQAAGMALGVTYGTLMELAANGRGQVVFGAALAGPGVIGGNNDRAVFYSQPDGRTAPILRMRDMVQTSPTTSETVYYYEFPQLFGSGADGYGSVLNDSGKFVFYVQFLNTPHDAIAAFQLPDACYANCDGSTSPPVLNANDFQCFMNRFASGNPYANCDDSTAPPVLNANDFQCFLNSFAAGCT